jgi:hypothetical protein
VEIKEQKTPLRRPQTGRVRPGVRWATKKAKVFLAKVRQAVLSILLVLREQHSYLERRGRKHRVADQGFRVRR